jgi:hypothetical protein
MQTPAKISEPFQALPYEEWKPTKNTLHLYLQVVGKIRLVMFPRLNHWWHVTLYVTPRGLSTRPIPHNSGSFEIDFDFIDHALKIKTSDGEQREFALEDGLSVAEFYQKLFGYLSELGIKPKIKAVPYLAPSDIPFADDTQNKSYDKEYVGRYHRTLVAIDDIFEEFRGRFTGKSTPVHVFWHSMDLALTRFSGKQVSPREGAGMVDREAYSHEVISFGFWAGDDKTVPAPAFYSYTAPEPDGLADEPLSPGTASWQEANGSHMALLMYEDIRNADDPRAAILEFLETAYQAGAKHAGWDIETFRLRPLI